MADKDREFLWDLYHTTKNRRSDIAEAIHEYLENDRPLKDTTFEHRFVTAEIKEHGIKVQYDTLTSTVSYLSMPVWKDADRHTYSNE